MALLSVDEALHRILEGAVPLATEAAGLLGAAGRVLASDIAARLTHPPFDASAMDGYAVQAADVAALPVSLTVIGEAAAGRGFSGSVGQGQTVRIFTGAPVPSGADAIVIQEHVSGDGATGLPAIGGRITVAQGIPDPEHIRRRGSDFLCGDVKLTSGRRLTARDITLAASMGLAELPVRRRPRVAILATGNELVPPGVTPSADQIVCSNPYGIAAMVRAAGGDAEIIGIARDTPESLDTHIAKAAGADILVTIGGASVGAHDLVVPALERAGMTLRFWKIAMRPGKPMIFGMRGAQRIIGLPGNPVSSLICTRVYVLPLVQRLLGEISHGMDPVVAELASPITANGPRTHYLRAATISREGGHRIVRPVFSQDSSLVSPLAAADCLLVREPNAPAAAVGDAVTILDLDF